jgi:DNA-binding transcriptional MerR regulator/effector-binding domain-containing protein
MAALNGVSVQALRLYDRLGLLEPERVDEPSGYRYYSIKQCARLDAIQHLQALGLSLKEIRDQLGREDPNALASFLEAQRILVRRRASEIERLGRAVDRALDNCRRYETAPTEGLIVLERLPERRIFRYDGGIDIYERGLEGYEEILRRLKAVVALRGLPMIYFCNVGSIVRRADLEAGRLRSTEIFLFVDEDFAPERAAPSTGENDGLMGIETIAEGTFACLYFEGFSKELAFADKLLSHIAANGMSIAGDYLCEVVAELPLFPKEERSMLIKLQIPISFI